jgi:TM2 domain-containing membrane protein YozV
MDNKNETILKWSYQIAKIILGVISLILGLYFFHSVLLSYFKINNIQVGFNSSFIWFVIFCCAIAVLVIMFIFRISNVDVVRILKSIKIDDKSLKFQSQSSIDVIAEDGKKQNDVQMNMQDRINNYLMQYQKYFALDKIILLREQLESLDERKFNIVTMASSEFKDPAIMLIVSIVIGYLGVDRFILGDIGIGAAKLLTVGGCGTLYIIDWFLITNKTKEFNYQKINSLMINLK